MVESWIIRQGRLEEAISHYSKALEIELNFVGPHYNLGLALAEQGDLEEAISYFSRAVRIDPDSTISRHNLSFALRQHKKGESLESHLK